ncbi:MAG: nucleoside triphosphate pyrophosphohydrolase [Clostridia bacterium]|nr:nucleoside triphosphate pyrophosphohydrolase [Clostridia bacterium]
MGNIAIVGLGWEAGQLTLEAAELLKGGARVVLHTERCGCADWLREQNIGFETLDALYESCEDFDEHIDAAASAVLEMAGTSDVVYGVADVRDRTAAELARRAGEQIRIIPGPPVDGALLPFAEGETRAVEASDWENFHLTPRENCLIRELDNRELAAEVKLRLMAVYPEESMIWVANAGKKPAKMPLYELDRCESYDHRTCVMVPAQRGVTGLERYDFEHLNELMRVLCGPGGCPWDRAQTHESLRTCILEEAYEVMDAIDAGDMDHLYDELGDVLLQVALHAEIARRHGEFDISDVTTAICEKMIHRHTHIFGTDHVEDAEEVLDLWSRNKMAERGQSTHTEAMRDVTRTLPALLRGVKVLKRAAEAGMGDADLQQAAERCADRLRVLPGAEDAEARLGEALLDVASVARLMKIDPEIALNRAVNRLIERFEAMEQRALEAGERLEELPEAKLKVYWDCVKL